MGDIAKIELSKDIIEPIVRAQLHASIVSALGRSDQLIGGVVQSILNTQVDSHGNPSRYSSDKPLITWMAEKAVKEAAVEAMKEWFATNKNTLKEQIQNALKKQNKMIAERLCMGLADEVSRSYRININVDFKGEE